LGEKKVDEKNPSQHHFVFHKKFQMGWFCPYYIKLVSIMRLRCSRGSVLAFGTQVRGLKPGRSSRIFQAKKSSARLPSEGKKSRLSHVVLYGM
jgi:hypothetical protein